MDKAGRCDRQRAAPPACLAVVEPRNGSQTALQSSFHQEFHFPPCEGGARPTLAASQGNGRRGWEHPRGSRRGFQPAACRGQLWDRPTAASYHHTGSQANAVGHSVSALCMASARSQPPLVSPAQWQTARMGAKLRQCLSLCME